MTESKSTELPSKPPRKPGWFALARIAYFAEAGSFLLTDKGWERLS